MQRTFEEQFEEHRRRLVLMGSVAETMVSFALRALIERNENHLEEVDRREKEVNAMEVEIDERGVTLMALQQPVASDVRFLVIAARITSELERIADQAVNISQGVRRLLRLPLLKPFVDLPIMGDTSRWMVTESLEALARRDAERARKVLREDVRLDALCDAVFKELLNYMMADSGTIPRALPMVLISRNLERVGDLSTNIAEDVIYWLEGRDVRHRAKVPTTPGEEEP